MKQWSLKIRILTVTLACLCGLGACDQFEEDVVPETFGSGVLKVHPDDIYVYNNKTNRVLSAANDTIESFDRITYSTPKNGTLVPNFDGIEGNMGYRPNPGYVGKDSLTYQVCSGQTCTSAKIRFFVEDPVVISNCVTTVSDDNYTTAKNKPVEMRIHLNDIICPSGNISVSLGSPVNGTFRNYSYYEGWKNEVLVYVPRRGFLGQDSFKYKVYPNGFNGTNPNEYIEAVVRITVQ